MPPVNLNPEGLFGAASEAGIKTKEGSLYAFFTDPAHIGLIIVAFAAMITLLSYLLRENRSLRREADKNGHEVREVSIGGQMKALQDLVQIQVDAQAGMIGTIEKLAGDFKTDLSSLAAAFRTEIKEVTNEFRSSIKGTTQEFQKSLGEVHGRITDVATSLSRLRGEHDRMLEVCPYSHGQVGNLMTGPARSGEDRREVFDRRRPFDRRAFGCPAMIEAGVLSEGIPEGQGSFTFDGEHDG